MKTMGVPISLIGQQQTIIVLFSMDAVGRHRVEQTAGLVRDRVEILDLANRRCVFTATRKHVTRWKRCALDIRRSQRYTIRMPRSRCFP
ncbi:hypothetical protein WK78_23675 [Burkholderia cepacia]|nr:hypothetical protein WK78_23675 [Burkholderia cepacia]